MGKWAPCSWRATRILRLKDKFVVVQLLNHSLRPCELQHPRLPCPSLSPEVCSNSCPLSRWCHEAISSFITPCSACLQSFPASGSFLMNQLFASSSQHIGASASVFPMNIQGWFPLGLTGLISLQSKGLSRIFSSTTTQKHRFVITQPSLWTNSLYFLQASKRCHLTLTWVPFSCSAPASKHPSLHPPSVESYEGESVGQQLISGPLCPSGQCLGHWSVHSDSTSLIVSKISCCCCF